MEILDILDGLVRWADDRYGKWAAWIALFVGLLVIAGGLALVFWYLANR